MSSTSQESEPSTNAPDERSRLVWNANPETAEPRRAKILLVEDEAIVALDIKTRLLHLGHEVVGVTSSGEDAIKIVEATRPDLVLMDIRLRGRLDGIEAAQQLRAQFDVAVIYLTAYGDDATLQRAKLTEPYGFLIKPFEERELHSTIEMAFYKSMMEKRVQQQIRRLQRTISTFPEGVALFDADNRIVMANPKAQAYLLTLSGATVGDLVERLGNATLAAFIEARDTGGWQDILSLDSPSRTFEAIATSLNTELDPLPVDVEGGPSDWMLVIRDVTKERQRAERMRLHERLAAVGQLVAGIAHDFNNIMSSIIVFTDILYMAESNISQKSRGHLDTIARQARHASDLVKQLLGFSHAAITEMQIIKLTPLLKEQVEMFERLLPENVQLKLVCQEDDYLVNGDPSQLLQALMNLYLNARDAMPDGGELSIEMIHCAEADLPQTDHKQHQAWLVIRVSDTGIGIQPDALPHLFEPFFTTKASGKGAGLGLVQVYNIVRQHEGCVSVESSVGKGTTFSVFLPMVNSAPAQEGGAETPASLRASGNSQSILVVEDNRIVRQAASDLLELMDYRVVAASNGREALTLLESSAKDVDLILSDLVMPEMGGIDLCTELRKKSVRAQIIIMSGYFSERDNLRLKSLAITNYIHKPLTAANLLKAIETALSSHGA
jgi:signal transduction histidine kinase